jgi:hypothetical protein
MAEYEMNDGYLSKKDPETGNIEIPGSFIKMVSENRIGLAEQRLVNIDEKGEELLDSLQDQLTKPPSQLLSESSGPRRDANGGLLPGQTIPFGSRD